METITIEMVQAEIEVERDQRVMARLRLIRRKIGKTYVDNFHGFPIVKSEAGDLAESIYNGCGKHSNIGASAWRKLSWSVRIYP